jgi:hypothetical protein
MIPLRRLQIKEKNTSRIVLIKSFGLFFHEALLFLFWTALLIFALVDESKLGMLEFYRKHLPAGLLLLPTKTKLLILVPALMGLFSFVMLSSRMVWEFDKLKQKIVKKSYCLFLLKILQKEWGLGELTGLRLAKENRKSPFVLELGNESGKLFFIDESRSEKKLDELGREIAILTGLKFFR